MITLTNDCVIKQTKRGGNGKIQVVKSTPCKCRVKEKFQLVINDNAEKVTSQIEFNIPVEINVKTGYQIEFEDNTYTILSIKITRNTLGEVVKKVVFV